ncbi:MAG TPA: sigma-70 family RNA polymerase sigma factor [Thermoanaerobaculia bacterium]|nr:sigma-70 family RNA polymerase sigma factor [Thermoanaerobaculia bacterium]
MDFEAAVRRHQRRVYTFARYLLASREEAEDVTQEVLLRLWRHGESLDPEMLTGWLLRVTRNACFDLLRRRRSAGAGMVAIVAIGPDESAARPSGELDPAFCRRPAASRGVAGGDPIDAP